MSTSQSKTEQTAEQPPNVPLPTTVPRPRTKRLRSIVWDHFAKVMDGNGVITNAQCNHCKKLFAWDNSCGTSTLRNHINGPCSVFTLPSASNTPYRSPRAEFRFDQLTSRTDLAIAVIKHNYPFNIGEHEFFERFCMGLNPNFKLPSKNTIKADVLCVFMEEKEKVFRMLDNLRSKIALTTDIWTSDHSNKAYCCLTTHFIDGDWVLQKKILAFKLLDYPHDGQKIFSFIRDQMLEWNINGKISSVVVDSASANYSMMTKLKEWYLEHSTLPFDGDLMHVRCSAHILNLVVQDGLALLRELIDDIRQSVRYLDRSPSAMSKFGLAKAHRGLQNLRSVAMDVPTRLEKMCLEI